MSSGPDCSSSAPPVVGARPRVEGGTCFRVWAPRAKQLALVLDPGEGAQVIPLEVDEEGFAVHEAADVAPGRDYVFRLEEGVDRPDPAALWLPYGVAGPSRVFDTRAHEWSDDGWQGHSLDQLIVYELHIGVYTHGGDLDALCASLPYLRELGVTAVQLMPVAEFPGERNWGYDGVFPCAVSRIYGGPAALQRFVDAAHREGLAVFLDAVYNHLGPEGNAFGEFGPYFNDQHHTPWGAALNFDGPDCDPVRALVLQSALQWFHDFHIDGLRLDAVHGIFDFSARHVLEELAEMAAAAGNAAGRPFHLVAESDLNAPRVVESREIGGWGLAAQWNDDFHHAQHVAVTGERQGYLADYEGLADLVKAVREGFVYDGRKSKFRRRRHGRSSRHLPADRFVAFTENHDTVGNASHGERVAARLDPRQQKVQAMLLLLGPNVPLLFMGQEYGETAPFEFFVDLSDDGLMNQVREGRQREAEFFGGRDALPDPGDPATFTSCFLDAELRERAPHAQLFAFYRALLRLRRERPGLQSSGEAGSRVDADPAAGWLRFTREGSSESYAIILNFARDSSDIPVELSEGRWRREFWSEAPEFGGTASSGEGLPEEIESTRDSASAETLRLPAWSGALYRRD